jgi:hypothetical protein
LGGCRNANPCSRQMTVANACVGQSVICKPDINTEIKTATRTNRSTNARDVVPIATVFCPPECGFLKWIYYLSKYFHDWSVGDQCHKIREVSLRLFILEHGQERHCTILVLLSTTCHQEAYYLQENEKLTHTDACSVNPALPTRPRLHSQY